MRHANGPIDMRQQAKHFWYAKKKTVKPQTEVLCTYQDGSPAAVTAHYGKGQVCASLFPFGWNDEVDAIFMRWLKQRIPLPQATCNEPLVEPVLRQDKKGSRYLCITNVNWDKACEPQFVLDGKYERLVDLGVGNGIPIPSEVRHGLTLFTRRLDPGEGTIVRLGQRTETGHPDALAKAAWARYLAVERRVSMCQRQGMDVEAEAQKLARMRTATEDGAYADAQSLAKSIRGALDRKAAAEGADKLVVLAKQLIQAIDASKHDLVAKARIHALRRMGEHAVDIDRKKAELYLGRAKGQINLAELPVRAGEIDIQCGRSDTAIKVDGNLGEWNVENWVGISSSRAWHGNPDNDEDISVQFAMMWDEVRLYIAVRATDDVVMNEVPVPRLPEQDGVEIHLNVLDDYGLPKEGGMGDGLPMPVYGPDDFQFVFGARGRICRPDGPWGNTLAITWVEGSQAASQERPGGYDLEIAIPWSGVFLKPVPGYTIGFTMSVNDCDHKGGKYEVQATYRGRQVCNNTEGWARVRLTE